ncbi:hypothetical protein GUJ93_ZPchr0006g44862 [Zizania palustris]|uniref:Uncharacterized protein n=1 Tax=Zizania palustris TaxID=103762 RepID=A0A8J5S825_ZIZPA|nr:hypothetical protein GUJ93_ZPchr0006g44862 [Zizania palustris]
MKKKKLQSQIKFGAHHPSTSAPVCFFYSSEVDRSTISPNGFFVVDVCLLLEKICPFMDLARYHLFIQIRAGAGDIYFPVLESDPPCLAS